MPKHFLILFITLLLLASNSCYSWGRDGHAIVGKLAIDQVDTETRDWLRQILGDTSPETIRTACNWPDVVRNQDQYQPTRPFHYVNLPRGTNQYLPARDCKDGRCVTEKIKYFSARLNRQKLGKVEHIKAFNWVCHLVGDLHQPLHAGFADDRGGNNVMVNYHGTSVGLHQLWDTSIIRRLHPNWRTFADELASRSATVAIATQWDLSEVDNWTNASHKLVTGPHIYLTGGQKKINKAYQQQADQIIQQQLVLAANHLAEILMAIHKNRVIITRSAEY